MIRLLLNICVLAILATSNSIVAEAATGKDSAEEKVVKKNTEMNGNNNALGKFKFGIAIGFENYKSEYVNEAETNGTNRVVRINDSQEMKPSLWLETHYIWDGLLKKSDGSLRFTHSAPGFYLGIRVIGPDSDTFDAFSLGLLWSFKRTAIGTPSPPGQITESINIGIGPVWHRTKELARGINEGEPLPSQFSDIKFDERDEVSWMLMVSVGF